jgi:alpha-tubulin suppressor-like RCC1 family protein
MKKWTILNLLWVAAAAGLPLSEPAAASRIRAWGLDSNGQVSAVPTGDTFTAIAAGDAYGLGLRADGTIAAWGQNVNGQRNVPTGTYRYVACGSDFSLAIRSDGSLAAWGKNTDGQVSNVPAGNNYVAVDGGLAFAVALKSDGSLVAWGNDRWSQVSHLPTGTDFKAVAAGDCHGVALRKDGTLATWGYSAAIQDTPTDSTFTAISAGGTFCVAIRSNGSLVWWGTQSTDYGLDDVPAGTDYVAVAAGYLHCIALKNDGSLVGWGAGTSTSVSPHWGQAVPPAGKEYRAVAAGLYHSLALTDATDTDTGTDTDTDTDGNTTPGTSTWTDDFNDNQRGSFWSVQASHSSGCWLEEINSRLELRATADTVVDTAYYVTNNWKIDPAKDFSFKIAYHYGLETYPLGWLAVGLTPDINDIDSHHLEFGPGCGRYNSHVWFEAVDKDLQRADHDSTVRPDSDGMLYVSYNAASDMLYLSTSGYGADSAWKQVSGLLRGAWAGRPIWLYLGGGSDGQEIVSGDAYLDTFVMDSGGPVTVPALSPVYRFWAPAQSAHFYTIDPNEKDYLIKVYASIWIYEGIAFRAAPTQSAAGLAPVYRFWSPVGLGHFYTIDPVEKQMLIDNYPTVWTFEKIAFYAYPPGSQPPQSKPVYRFWQPKEGTHFYTINAAEKDFLLQNYPAVFTAEGVAFYTFE